MVIGISKSKYIQEKKGVFKIHHVIKSWIETILNQSYFTYDWILNNVIFMHSTY
jgi:hypothetical protein